MAAGVVVSVSLVPKTKNIKSCVNESGHSPFLKLNLRPSMTLQRLFRHLRKIWVDQDQQTCILGEQLLALYAGTPAETGDPQCWRENSHAEVTLGQIRSQLGNPEPFMLRYNTMSRRTRSKRASGSRTPDRAGSSSDSDLEGSGSGSDTSSPERPSRQTAESSRLSGQKRRREPAAETCPPQQPKPSPSQLLSKAEPASKKLCHAAAPTLFPEFEAAASAAHSSQLASPSQPAAEQMFLGNSLHGHNFGEMMASAPAPAPARSQVLALLDDSSLHMGDSMEHHPKPLWADLDLPGIFANSAMSSASAAAAAPRTTHSEMDSLTGFSSNFAMMPSNLSHSWNGDSLHGQF